MKERLHNRNRFFTKKNITIGGGILAVFARVIYNDMKKENGFIKSIFRKITGSYKNSDPNNIIDITGSVKIKGSDKEIKKQEKIL